MASDVGSDGGHDESLARLVDDKLGLQPPSRLSSWASHSGRDAGDGYRSMVYASDDDDDDGPGGFPIYRDAADTDTADDDVDDELPIYRSASAAPRPPAALPQLSPPFNGKAPYGSATAQTWPTPTKSSKSPAFAPVPPPPITLQLTSEDSSHCKLDVAPEERRAAINSGSFFELPSDVVDAVLSQFPASPDLFTVMRVCKAWRRFGWENYCSRVVVVPSTQDALVHAVASARAGDTLCLRPGIHVLNSELTIDRPLRLLAESEPEAAALLSHRAARSTLGGRSGASGESAAELGVASIAGDGGPHLGESVESPVVPSASTGSAGAVVLVANLHVLLRTRCTTVVTGITLCRMGDEVGYPNAVAYAEAGKLRMERCRVTCGGTATSVTQALQAFDGAPEPGAVWLANDPTFAPHGSGRVSGRDSVSSIGSSNGGFGSSSSFLSPPASPSAGSPDMEAMAPLWPGRGSGASDVPPLWPGAGRRASDSQKCPQSGVWVGAAASVYLTGCTIAACMGPGVKIYRGCLKAQRNTIAYSTRGANVVANGGQVILQDNEIKGANGDGISSWHDSQMCIERNSIHANSGSGIAVNHGGKMVSICDNAVFNNACQNVMFHASHREATMHDNDFEGSSARATGRSTELPGPSDQLT